ncbi:hypothetical protein EJD97_002249 [Solanum chilense]|uniref:FAS1 domain-containing protein n=1 Tax=Solanum chilense TaxID=4083 RepID=A0A6N2ALW6_SOLCI|nr:hypothetical protein EJD97_002249 [Solanum chilense]
MKMALRTSVVVTIATILFLLYLLIYTSFLVRNANRVQNLIDVDDQEYDLDLYQETEYKTPLRNFNLKVNNGGNEMFECLNQSRFHIVSLASVHDLSSISNLKVNNGGIVVQEYLNHSAPVHLISFASVSPTMPPTFPPPTPSFSTTATSSPPPPSLTQRQIQEQQLNNILQALIGAGDFVGWANLLSSADLSSLPLTATFFIPGKTAMADHQTVGVQNLDPLLIAYHIIPQRLSFSDLQQLKPNTRIPTLLPSKFIIVTNNSLSNFTIDGSQITYPDLYVSLAFTFHGVDKILEYSVNNAEPLLSPPVESPPIPDAHSTHSPPLKPKFPPFFPARGRGSGSDSNIPFSIEKLMGFLSVSIFLLQ